MAKRYITENSDGTIAITRIAGDDPDGHKLTKALFELSRTTDLTGHFDPGKHTRPAIATGLPKSRLRTS